VAEVVELVLAGSEFTSRVRWLRQALERLSRQQERLLMEELAPGVSAVR
jgi:hypothetical protein